MQPLLINGSPRGASSNSRVILSWIAEGLSAAAPEEPVGEILDLAPASRLEAQLKAVLAVPSFVLAFPLYTDAAPALVKGFLEALALRASGPNGESLLAGKRAAFVVQSGFPESIHGEATAAWLGRLCARLGLAYAGTVVKGGMEGTRLQPEAMTRGVRRLFVRAGTELARDGAFSADTVARLAEPRRFGPAGRLAIRLMGALGLMNAYWDMNLRKHGAYERRFDAPWGQAARRP